MELRLPDTARGDFELALERARSEHWADRILDQDATLWGPEAEEEACIRLGWTQANRPARDLLPQIEELRATLLARGIDRVVLCGMGGSSLAPEMICRATKVPLVVLDSSHPDMVRSALVELERTVVVVSSKSGGTVETDSLMRTFVAAFEDAGLDPHDHVVVVTDPGTSLDETASAQDFRTFRADPNVGGRFSALTAFGLVPSGLAGADLARLIDEAESADVLSPDLGVLLGVAHRHGHGHLELLDTRGHGLGEWIEQLVAESTGKEGTGILPVVLEDESAPGAHSLVVHLGAGQLPEAPWAATIPEPLGAQLLLWEVATSIAGKMLEINPFDQPDVESAKAAAREMLSADGDVEPPRGIDVDALAEAFRLVPEDGYLAVQAYLDRWAHADFAAIRGRLSAALGRTVTFGWGPRFLHSTGQFHKGGPANGVFVQITDTPLGDLAVPGREFTFGEFIAAQAAGDAQVLDDRDVPVVRILLGPGEGPADVVAAVEAALVKAGGSA